MLSVEYPARFGITKDGLFYKHVSPLVWDDIQSVRPQLDALAANRHAPRIEGFEKDSKMVRVFLERINGFDLSQIPGEYMSAAHSREIAGSLAKVSQAMDRQGLKHTDNYGRNYMYNTETQGCMVVDFDDINPKRFNNPLDPVVSYSFLLLNVYVKWISAYSIRAVPDANIQRILVQDILQRVRKTGLVDMEILRRALRIATSRTPTDNFDQIINPNS